MFGEISVRKRLEAGRVQLAVFSNLGNAPSVEIAARTGFDVVILDHEHSPASLDNALACMNAARGTNAEIWVRVPASEQAYIKRVLDCGADGIMAPMIESAEDARRLVSYANYPPKGIRGHAPGANRHTSYGFLREEYYKKIGDNLSVMLQIETADAVKNIESIVDVDGITIFFIGPFDLSAAMGCLGQFAHPDLVAAIDKVEKAVKSRGKILGTMAVPGGKPVADLVAAGYQFIITGSDIIYMKAGMLEDFKKADAARLTPAGR